MWQVSVIIPVYNGAQTIRDTIRSVLSQTYRQMTLYLVDDGSTDGTGEIASYFCNDQRVRVIRQANSGQAAAINHGLRLSRDPLVSLCDADDLWRPDRLELCVATLRENTHSGLIC